MSIVMLINKTDEVLESYSEFPKTGSLHTLARCSMWLLTLLTDINRQLRACHHELEKGVVTEPFPFSFWKNEKHRQLKGSAMETDLLNYGDETLASMDMTFSIVGHDIKEMKDFFCAIDMEYEEMNNHLESIHDMIMTLTPAAYGAYYMTRKTECDDTTVKKKYRHMKMDLLPLTTQ